MFILELSLILNPNCSYSIDYTIARSRRYKTGGAPSQQPNTVKGFYHPYKCCDISSENQQARPKFLHETTIKKMEKKTENKQTRPNTPPTSGQSLGYMFFFK